MKHIGLTCRNHPHLRWMCKEIAVNKDGSYNGARNIFFLGTVQPDETRSNWALNPIWTEPECSCSASDLTFAPLFSADDLTERS